MNLQVVLKSYQTNASFFTLLVRLPTQLEMGVDLPSVSMTA